MKSSVTKFFHNPKAVTIVSLIIAVVIGVFGYYRIHKAPAYTYATAGAGIITTSGSGSAALQDLTLGFVAGGKIGTVNVKAGDTVKAGDVLATLDAQSVVGALTQAKAAYAAAQANYAKVIAGATGSAINVAKAAVNTAQVNLDQATAQQARLVANAHSALLNSTVAAIPASGTTTVQAPVISGTYTGTTEGMLDVVIHTTGGGSAGYFTLSGLATGTGQLNTTSPSPLGSTGLSIFLPTIGQYDGTEWTITLPNTLAPNYLPNLNAYTQAQATQTQVLAATQAGLTQAQANLTALVTNARPEDVAAAQASVDSALGAVQVAEGAYNNTIITAPGAGTVTAVSITPGQIATPNAPAIELYATSVQKSVAVMVPVSAVVNRNGQDYVEKKTASGIVETAVTIGAEDASNVEIVSGLAVGDQVVTH